MEPSPSGRLTLRDVARAAGVSRTTASNAFNRPDQLSAAVRDRVLAAAAALGYAGPDPAARMLRTGAAGVVGLVFKETLAYAFADPHALSAFHGLAAVLERDGLGLLLLPRGPEATVAHALRGAVVDGVVLFGAPDEPAVVGVLRERRLPFVTLDQDPVDGAPAVNVADRAGARAVAAHLVGLGHRHFGVLSMELLPDGQGGPAGPERIAGVTFAVTRDRLAGYADALRAAGLDPSGVPVEEGPSAEADGYDGARRLLARAPRPTAILAMSDRLAAGALRAAADLGLAVPGDVSLAGFDDAPFAAALDPPLTSVAQPAEAKGRHAAELLLGAVEAARAGAPVDAAHVVLDARLVVRSSTGPVPS